MGTMGRCTASEMDVHAWADGPIGSLRSSSLARLHNIGTSPASGVTTPNPLP